MNPPHSMIDSFSDAEWDTLAYTMKTLSIGVEGKTADTRKLRAQAGMVRLILCDKMGGFNGDNSLDLSFFMASFKTIQKMEIAFDANHVKKREFLIFLKLLLAKFERQKLSVKKPRAMLAEFDRMKGVIEDGESSLR